MHKGKGGRSRDGRDRNHEYPELSLPPPLFPLGRSHHSAYSAGLDREGEGRGSEHSTIGHPSSSSFFFLPVPLITPGIFCPLRKKKTRRRRRGRGILLLVPSQLPPKAPTPSSSKTDPSCCDHSPPPLPQRSHSPLLPAALFSLFSYLAKKATCSYATRNGTREDGRTERAGEILFPRRRQAQIKTTAGGREEKSLLLLFQRSVGLSRWSDQARADQRFNHRETL